MFADTEMLTEVVHAQEFEKPMTERELKRLRAAEARHRLELLQEARTLHDHLRDVWDERSDYIRRFDA